MDVVSAKVGMASKIRMHLSQKNPLYRILDSPLSLSVQVCDKSFFSPCTPYNVKFVLIYHLYRGRHIVRLVCILNSYEAGSRQQNRPRPLYSRVDFAIEHGEVVIGRELEDRVETSEVSSTDNIVLALLSHKPHPKPSHLNLTPASKL